jgi:hypothetical protein
MPLGRILPWPTGIVPTQPACAARAAQPGPARPRPAQRARSTAWPSSTGASVRAARGGAARLRCGGDLTGAREAAEESMAGPHRRVNGGATELVGVDGGVGRHGEAWMPASGGTVVRRQPTRSTMERVSAVGRRENAAARRAW